MIIHRDIEQRSPEWHALRLARVTGTKFKDLCASRGSTFDNLCKKIAAEKLLGVSCEKPFKISDAMQHGIDTEDEARAAYELDQFVRVDECAFIEKDEFTGCSPDGLVGEDGMFEAKCPQNHTHLGYLASKGNAHKAYRWQLQGQLWCSGREWVDFVSYNPLFDEDKRLIIERIHPSEKDFALIDERVVQLKDEVSRLLRVLESVQ